MTQGVREKKIEEKLDCWICDMDVLVLYVLEMDVLEMFCLGIGWFGDPNIQITYPILNCWICDMDVYICIFIRTTSRRTSPKHPLQIEKNSELLDM